MTVIMSYHALVERDSKYVDSHWKIITCVLLCAVAASAFLSSFNLNEIQNKYGENCFIDAELVFDTHDNKTSESDSDSDSDSGSSDNAHKPNSTNEDETEKNNDTDKYNKDVFKSRMSRAYDKQPEKKKHLFQFKTKQQTFELFSDNDTSTNETEKNNTNISIDEDETIWGSQSQCTSTKFVPMMEAYVAIIFLILFIMCGHGGKGNASFLSKPWSIVCPAFVVFSIFTLISFGFMFYMSEILTEFCNNLKLNFDNTREYSCGEIFNHFVIEKEIISNATASFNYTLVKLCMFVTFLLWFFLLLLTLLRIIFVIDFQLIRVTITKINVDRLEIVDLEEERPILVKKNSRP